MLLNHTCPGLVKARMAMVNVPCQVVRKLFVLGFVKIPNMHGRRNRCDYKYNVR
jgi:hypothetical protein